LKVLHLMRHAKSSWNQPGLADRERALNKRGQRDAPRMGTALSRRMEPVSIHTSPAHRAQLTLAGLCSGWPALGSLTHSTEEALYTFSGDDLAHWISARDDSVGELFLIGHNPALTVLINWLTGEHSLDNLPTAAYARLELTIPAWSGLDAGCGVVQDLLLPRSLDKT